MPFASKARAREARFRAFFCVRVKPCRTREKAPGAVLPEGFVVTLASDQ
jgi:hypothetical protein